MRPQRAVADVGVALESALTSTMLGLYLHIPFCSAICNYCNFNRGLFDAVQKARYVDALLAEIAGAPETRSGPAGRGAAQTAADTIFFGGGTPSLLEPGEIGGRHRRVRARVRRRRRRGGHPRSQSRDASTDGSARRLSRGRRQSPELRRAVVPRRRAAAAVAAARRDRARAAFAEARAAGFDNISLDLMMWLPGQRERNGWNRSIGRSRSRPSTLSLYLLEVYPNAPLRGRDGARRWSQAPDEDAAAMYLKRWSGSKPPATAVRDLQRARPGRRVAPQPQILAGRRVARVRLRRALDPCGRAMEECRRRPRNTSSSHRRLEQPLGRATCGGCSPGTSAGRCLFTGLRLSDGVDIADIVARYGVDVWATVRRRAAAFLDEGLLQRETAATVPDPPGNASCS